MVNLAFIGTGKMAQMHVNSLLKNEQVKIIKCYDLNLPKARDFAEKYGGKACDDVQDIYSCNEVDTVYICTRHDSHEEYAINAMKNKKHVFIEKPLTLNYCSAKKIIDIYKETGKVLKVGFNMRVTPSVMRFKQLLQENNVNAEIFEAKLTPPPFMNSWTGDMHFGGGVLACLGCHMFDFINYILGVRIKEINCSLKRLQQPESLMENSAVLMLRMENGIEGSLILHDRGVKGYHVDPAGKMQSMTIYSNQGSYYVESYGDINYSTKSNFIMEKTGSLNQLELWGYQKENDLFIEELSGKKTILCDIYSAAETVLVVDAAKESAMTGRWITIDYK